MAPTTARQVPRLDFKLITNPDNLQPRPSRLSSLSRADRVSRLKGQKVHIAAKLTGTNNEEQVGTGAPLALLRAASPILDEQLSSAVATPNFKIKKITHIVIEVTSIQALRSITSFLHFNIAQHNGSLGKIQYATVNAMYRHMRILEVARAIEFDHIVTQMEERLEGRLYKGGNKKYWLSTEDVVLVYNAPVQTATLGKLKDQIVEAVAQAYVDGNLINVRDVNELMGEIEEFGVTAAAETERRQVADASKIISK